MHHTAISNAAEGLHHKGFAPEAKQTLANICSILERHGCSTKDVVKCTVFLADMKAWPAFNELYRQVFKAPFPARSALGTNGLALGARVEVECIALVPRHRSEQHDRKQRSKERVH